MKVAIVSYGAGNLPSVARAFQHLGATPVIVSRSCELVDASRVVVPGVGHFAATAPLDESWRAAIRDCVKRGTPVLGICLGMQWLYDGSDEAPELTGLGWFSGRCRRLSGPEKVPHVGWNTIDRDGRESVYFSHTYAAPVTTDTTATCTHGEAFAAVVERGGVVGMQFHPEKSGRAGLGHLQRFLERGRV
jgi:glutamine amidotransferase